MIASGECQFRRVNYASAFLSHRRLSLGIVPGCGPRARRESEGVGGRQREERGEVDPLARFHLPWLPCLLSSSLAFLPSSALFLFVCLIWIPDADDALRVTDRIVFLYSFLFVSFLFFLFSFFLFVCLGRRGGRGGGDSLKDSRDSLWSILRWELRRAIPGRIAGAELSGDAVKR